MASLTNLTMTEVFGEHSRYQLINSNPRRKCLFDGKTLILISVVTLPVLAFCTIYMALFGIYEKVIYPKTRTFDKVPVTWINRAKLYNSYTYNTTKTLSIMNSLGRFADVDDFKLVCYYNFPSGDQNELKEHDIDPSLCTHINVGFANIVNNTVHLEASQIEIIKKIVDLKKENSILKVLISVGGAGNQSNYPDMVVNHINRKMFIKSILNLVKEYRIDGVDLDWEFPNENTVNDKYQRMHFTQLLEEFRKTINKQTKHTFLLTVAVAAPTIIVDNAYDVAYMNQYVDFVNLMSYDYHFFTRYTPFTGLNSPLYAAANDKIYQGTLNINYSAHYWNSLGMDRNKIVVGLPTYGHSYTLLNIRNNVLNAPARGYGKLGSNGFVDFNQICAFLSANQISPVFDMDTKSPYATKYSEWISFDDEESLSYKAEYIKYNKFGGAMVYALNTDDHRGNCVMGGKLVPTTFPLTRKIKQILSKSVD